MNLYQLTELQHALHKRLELAGFDDQTIADSLEGDENTEVLKEKRLGYVAIIKMKRAMATARASAAAEITELAEREAEAADKLEAMLLSSMLKTGDADLVGIEFEAHVKGKAAAVVIKDLAAIPKEYMRLPEPKPPEAAPDKKAIAAAIASGKLVPGCELGSNKRLSIK